MQFNENEVYIFNPAYVMRNDSRRIVLFAGNKPNRLSESNWSSILHPAHARIFSFFTFDRQLKETVSLLSKYLKRDEQAVRNIVFPFIENPQSVYTKYKENKVWNSPAAKKLLNLERTDIQEQSLCKSCKLFEPCFHAMNRCWVDIVKAYGKENWDYPDPRCALAPQMVNDLRF